MERERPPFPSLPEDSWPSRSELEAERMEEREPSEREWLEGLRYDDRHPSAEGLRCSDCLEPSELCLCSAPEDEQSLSRST